MSPVTSSSMSPPNGQVAPPQPVDIARDQWQGRSRVVLQPVAAPSILGFFAFAAVLVVVGGHLAGWYDDPRSPLSLAWLPALLGGGAQFYAATVAFRARDGLAVAIHGSWGALWIGYGLLGLLFATGVVVLTATPLQTPELGLWLLVVAAVTAVAAVAALAEQVALCVLLLVLSVGAALLGAADLGGSFTLAQAAAWVLLLAGALAWYQGAALLLAGSYGRQLLPLGRTRTFTDVEGQPIVPIEFELGEPGVRRGQ